MVSNQADEQKPTWDDDIDISDLVPPAPTSVSETQPAGSKKKKKKKKKNSEGEEEVGVDPDEMDADVERSTVQEEREEEWDGTEEMRKRVLDKYMDEVYGLEFNDMVLRSISFCPASLTSWFYRSVICLPTSGILVLNHPRSA